MVICLEWGAGLHMAQLLPLPPTLSCFSKIQVDCIFLVLAHPGSPRQRAVKRVCVCGPEKFLCPARLHVSCDAAATCISSISGHYNVLFCHNCSRPKMLLKWSWFFGITGPDTSWISPAFCPDIWMGTLFKPWPPTGNTHWQIGEVATSGFRLLDRHTHTHPFNGPFYGSTQVSRYQKGNTNLDFYEARDSEWQWRQLGHMHVCTLLLADNHASAPPLSFLQAGCPSWHPTNSVKALKADTYRYVRFVSPAESGLK